VLIFLDLYPLKMKHRDRGTGRKWEPGAAKRQKKKQLAAEIMKIKRLTNFFTVSARPEKDVEASVSTTPDLPVQVQSFETVPENLSDQSDLLSQESSASSVSSAVDSTPEQVISDNIALVSDDPALWPGSVSADETGPKFNIGCYSRRLVNGEKVSRSLLVYSIENNSVFCFCCKLYSNRQILLSSEKGCSDWRNIGQKLKEHDTSPDHVNCMQKWKTLAVYLNASATIDNSHQRLIEEEKKHWRSVLEGLFAIVQTLAERSLAFRGQREDLYEPNNGNFLSQVRAPCKI
jgi:hypothetical protein